MLQLVPWVQDYMYPMILQKCRTGYLLPKKKPCFLESNFLVIKVVKTGRRAHGCNLVKSQTTEY